MITWKRIISVGPLTFAPFYCNKRFCIPIGRTTTWASFSNRDAVLDTTMISERFHLRIKDEFLHRNGNSRLDALVDLLIKCVEDLSGSIEVKVISFHFHFLVQSETVFPPRALKHGLTIPGTPPLGYLLLPTRRNTQVSSVSQGYL